MNKLLFCLSILFLAVGCNQTAKQETNPHRIKVVEAVGTVPDSTQAPETISYAIPQAGALGEPVVNITNRNVRVVNAQRIVKAGLPTVNTPGTNGLLLPKTQAAHGKVKPAGVPEVVIAKDGAVKDQNPANFSVYKTLQGLKHNTVRCMLQDKGGNIWFGTNGGGASRYDGKSFTSFTEKQGLNSNIVLCMLEDNSGNIWFGTYGGGVCRYDGKCFTSFTREEGLSDNVVFCMMEDRNVTAGETAIWFGTADGGACFYDGKSFTNYTVTEGLVHNTVNCMLQDKTGNLWFGTNGGGVSCYDGKSFLNFSEKEGLFNNVVYCMLEDKAGNIWFGTNGAACRYDGNRVNAIDRGENIVQGNIRFENGKAVTTFTYFAESEGLVNGVIVCMAEEKDVPAGEERIWFGTNGGASKYVAREGDSSGTGKTFTNFTESEGLSNNMICSFFEDQTGTLWLGTIGGGVCRYDGNTFLNYTDKEGLSTNVVYSIAEDKTGNLWFGTYGRGVCRYDGNSFSNFTEERGVYSISNILEDRSGNLWFNDEGEVGKYNPSAPREKNYTRFGVNEGFRNSPLYMMEDKAGNMWFGGNGGGVYRYNTPPTESDSGSITYFDGRQGLVSDLCYSILEDKNGVFWFGTQTGVSRYDPKAVSGNSFLNFTAKEGLTNNAVLCILEDNAGNIWFGTNGDGAIRYDGKYFTHFTEKEGLVNNAVLNVLQDTQGNIWFGTRKGLSKLTKNKLKLLSGTDLVQPDNNFDPIREALFYNYGYNDGFIGFNCRKNAVFQDSKGRIWWGADVLTCYDPAGDAVDTSAPVVNLTSVSLFGETVAWSQLNAVYSDSTGNEIVKGAIKDTLLSNGILLKDIQFDGLTKWYNLPQHLSLPYNNNNLTFNFIGVHMQSCNHIRYQYKLEGLDGDWSSITGRTEAPYGNLPAGDYIFKVKAMNQSGVWSAPFEFAFVVRPPWWQTWWFRIFVLAGIVAGIWLYIKRRERKLKIEKEVLEQTVEERTAEVVAEKKIVEQKNILVEAQKNVIEEKHREITDSINYAERIQRSFMATKELLDENLKDYFVFFQPKDVVSGDFYWASKVVNPKGTNQFLLATADSTGHGVPGAIMSLLNISSLEKSIGHETEPAAILNSTREIIIDRLKKDGSREGGKDGMDCSLISFDYSANTLTYAAANNPVWIIRDKVLREYSPDKMPVGKHDNDNILFTQHTVALEKGDVVYTFTDGMPDQFGGPKGKKFMYKQLKELLISIAHEPMHNQKQKLKTAFDTWKGGLEQIDDVCVIGVRIG